MKKLITLIFALLAIGLVALPVQAQTRNGLMFQPGVLELTRDQNANASVTVVTPEPTNTITVELEYDSIDVLDITTSGPILIEEQEISANSLIVQLKKLEGDFLDGDALFEFEFMWDGTPTEVTFGSETSIGGNPIEAASSLTITEFVEEEPVLDLDSPTLEVPADNDTNQIDPIWIAFGIVGVAILLVSGIIVVLLLRRFRK